MPIGKHTGQAFDHVAVVSTAVTRITQSRSGRGKAAATVNSEPDCLSTQVMARQIMASMVTRPAVPGGCPSLSRPECGTQY